MRFDNITDIKVCQGQGVPTRKINFLLLFSVSQKNILNKPQYEVVL
jgi:hypothetical protein